MKYIRYVAYLLLGRKGVMPRLRKLVYRLGFRPKYGSLFYSPSWELRVGFDHEAFRKAMNNAFENEENKNAPS